MSRMGFGVVCSVGVHSARTFPRAEFEIILESSWTTNVRLLPDLIFRTAQSSIPSRGRISSAQYHWLLAHRKQNYQPSWPIMLNVPKKLNALQDNVLLLRQAVQRCNLLARIRMRRGNGRNRRNGRDCSGPSSGSQV
jgi:hypothetical protein